MTAGLLREWRKAVAATPARLAVLDLAPGLAPTTGDPIQLQQVVMNLMLNAFAAMDHSGRSTRRLLVRTRMTAGDGASVQAEFQPRQAELQGLQTRITTLTKEIDDSQAVADPNALRQKRDQLAQLNTEFKRKGEDAEAAYAKRRHDIFTPLQQDIGKALEVFAKSRGITVIVDGSQVPVVYAADSIDITRAFIADFSSKNPATASVPQP